MSSIIGRSAFRATRPLAFRAAQPVRADAPAEKDAGRNALKSGARRDPELYILFTIMTGAFALVGWHFSRSPTSSTSEKAVAIAHGSEPWKEEGTGPYKYHPGGDRKAPKKDAPSALNTVVVPNVNLPKELHDQFNKYGKDGY